MFNLREWADAQRRAFADGGLRSVCSVGLLLAGGEIDCTGFRLADTELEVPKNAENTSVNVEWRDEVLYLGGSLTSGVTLQNLAFQAVCRRGRRSLLEKASNDEPPTLWRLESGVIPDWTSFDGLVSLKLTQRKRLVIQEGGRMWRYAGAAA